ncbi:GntR family transcriptional regulator [Paractinoplanes rishiriensis]|uniref:GntR family transcriptional regulator n=1 Tax=Paractinoplanes rishiriensis TaxID=1050105 RepID=A0A919JTC3_9ACTN|nr:GntR family transcriptional regulator [Actinoplanes rishiriensis]GIE93310.1 GntR family transcriptional regulator [Actinoplanes rishiriensis]
MYRKIAADLRDKIKSGELPPGSLLPTQQELSRKYEVARMTTRQAIAELINEGLVVAQQGRGVTVRDRQQMVYRPQDGWEAPTSPTIDRFTAAFTRHGRNPSMEIDVSVVQADDFVAERLGVEPRSQVVARRRVISLDGTPFHINDTYYPYELVRDTEIMSPADIPGGSNYVLAERGYRERYAIDEFFIRMPTPEEIGRLRLNPGTPVAMHVVTGFTAREEPVRCDIFILPGDRHVIMYERVHPIDDEGRPVSTPRGGQS